MMEIKKFASPREFLEYNEELLNAQYFEHFHLHQIFSELRKGEIRLIAGYNIIDDDDSNAIIVRVREEFYIYSNKWNEKLIDFLETELKQIQTEVKLLRGRKEIILELVERMKLKYEILNDRLIYYCENVAPLSNKIRGKFGIANISDWATIERMSVDYYIEEFEGKGQQPIDSVKASAYKGIKSGTIFKWSANGRIVSIARLIGDNPFHAMIGGLFTKVIERKKGYAYILTSELTRHLLNKGISKCGILTEATKIPTNKIFEKVGYRKVYDWINILTK
jgi:predicted GNAT family acetyltransferase